MKKKYERVLAVLLVAVFVLGLCSNVRVRAEEKDNQRTQMDLMKAEEIIEDNVFRGREKQCKMVNETLYEYPIKPNTNEWKSFKTTGEMYEATQIPEEILDEMSTEVLLNSVMNHPLIFSVLFCHENHQKGIEVFANNFNGMSELLERSDFEAELAYLYKEGAVAAQSVSNDEEFFLKSYVENILLSYAYDNMDMELKEAVTIVAMDRLEKSIKNQIEYNTLCDTFFLERSQMSETDNFFEVYTSKNDDGLTNTRITTTTVLTPKGSKVSVFTYDSDFTKAEKDAINAEIRAKYPNASYVSTSTKMYNCHSYAWYSSSINNTYWMNSPSKYMSDGSYSEVSIQDAGSGHKLYWSGGEHSGNILRRQGSVGSIGPINSVSIFLVTSKWGSGPLMTHSGDCSPYYNKFESFTSWKLN